MNEPAHVLLIGNDPMSRHDQTEVLRHFWVMAAADGGSFVESLKTSNVAVLCHSLSEQERYTVVEVINRLYPGILVVKMNGYDSGPHAGLDASVDLHHGPGGLVSTIYQLLTERGIASRGWCGYEYEVTAAVI